jgi:cytochrome c-type biogenesis protein CcmH
MATERSRKVESRGASQRRGEVRFFFAFALALALTLIPTLVAADELDDRVREIAKVLRCPVCSGETVADSNAPVSVQMRGVIREKLEAGETPDQIKTYFVERYGESILLSPETRGFTLGVWVMPVVALLLGLAIVLAVLRSWSRRTAPVVAADPVAPPPVRALPLDDDARLEQELANFRRTRGGVRG